MGDGTIALNKIAVAFYIKRLINSKTVFLAFSLSEACVVGKIDAGSIFSASQSFRIALKEGTRLPVSI